MKGRYSDEQLIHGLKTRDNYVLKYLLERYHRKIAKYVIKNKGTKQDADDLFQDTICIMFKVVNSNEFKIRCTFDAYFTTMFRNIWISEVKLRFKMNQIDIIQETLIYEETDKHKEIVMEKMQNLALTEFMNLDKEHSTLLDMFYYKKKSMAEIAYKMGYKNANSAKALKCNALGRLKERIKATSLYNKLENE